MMGWLKVSHSEAEGVGLSDLCFQEEALAARTLKQKKTSPGTRAS